MGKQLLARGQVTISEQKDALFINPSIKEYVFAADSNGTITKAITFTSAIKVTQGDVNVTNFTIGSVSKPTGFSSITINNTNKTVTFLVSANTTNLAESGIISIPITVDGVTYQIPFLWSKTKDGVPGNDAYTVSLSRTNYVVSTDKDGKLHTDVSVSTAVTAYKGISAITPVIGTLPTVAGCMLSKSGTVITILFKSGTTLAENGLIDIPVTVDSRNFTLAFSYAKARTGASGVDANMLDWIKDWNTNKTVIDANSVITPKIFAGTKNSNGTLTGVAIGKFPLSAMNASGQIVTETINGIYGFKDGYKTFFIDSSGSAQLGRGNQFIKYNSATGKVEFGSEVSLNWTNAINTAKSQAISAAATDATTKANDAKNSAVSIAATDATNKVNSIQVGGENLLLNSDFSSYSINNSLAWDKTLNGNCTITSWGSGYNSSVSNPTIGYHAHLNTTRFGFPVLEYINQNSQFGYSKRWMGLSTSVYQKEKLQPGEKYTFSADVMVDKAGVYIHGGLHSRKTGATSNTFSSGQYKLEPSKINKWERVSFTFVVDAEIDLSQAVSFYIYGYQGAEGIIWVKNVSLQLGTKGSWVKSNSDWSKDISDAKNAGLGAQTTIDALNKKASDEKWSTKLTYIDGNGIFTGILSANTVNAIKLNASQITAGTIDTARLNVDALKASLITAGNINALTLNVVRGKIGGWSVDSDSIYRGTKNNTSGGYTAASGSITIGSNGIRGFKWRLDATGAGALAGGNINWDASGNVTFAASVSLSWTSPINEIVTKLGGSTYPKLTYISGTGIYTGTLTATQVNAVSIDAASIKAGTLSVDRIAAGSIMATKLNVANVQAAVVTAAVVNGLTCTFVRGTIGGWTIASNSIYHALSGRHFILKATDGDSPLGSNRGHRGFSMYNDDAAVDTGRVKIIQIGALADKNTTQTYSTETNYGFRIALKGGTDIFRSDKDGSLIAGWNFDTDSIYRGTKNNASGGLTSASGGITIGSNGIRGFKWRLDSTGAGAIAGGNISWDASGNVTFAASVSLNWTKSIGDIVTGLGGSTYPKLTYISNTGIYTGTLTATQVNAVSINAGSIKAGTLSVDRLAAGSITAAKLNVANVQAAVVTAAVVNGLSCTFTKGKIGGWTIGADNITIGSVGTVGAMPIQIRSASTGSGYVYSGAFKPYGLTMTWYQSSNAGHFVFGQVNATGNTVKTGFIGIQMMSWDHQEYFCLSANYTKSGSKEIYNRIAGWGFDNTKIWKNNVSLGADGSIQNSTKWQLNNDGSGRVAGGNISWNASGVVTFASSVSLNWTNAANSALTSAKSYADTQKTEAINTAATDATTKANAAKELAQAMAFGKMIYRDPTFYNGINSTKVYNNAGGGTVTVTRASDANAPNDSKMVLVIKNTGASSPSCGGFSFQTTTSYRKVFITRIIAKIPTGRNISYHSNSIGTGGSQKWLTPIAGTGDWFEYICKITCGTASFSSTNFFAITGAVGTTTAPVEWRIAYATCFDVTSAEKYTTTIDANGIYTGKLSAGQVNVDTALIVGGSTYNGSISVRDASNAVKVTLNRSGITAVAGTIGGWVIASTQISKNGIILGADGSITNGTKWKLNYDGSGQLAGGNITWTTTGSLSMTGTINATGGKIGGFDIASGHIGTSATGSGSGGALAIYSNFFRVGSSVSYAMLGDDTFPATAGGTFKTTARITNNRYDSYYTNIGIYIDVTSARRNFGIRSNAPLMSPAHVSTRVPRVAFGSGSYNIDFSQNNLFFVYTTTNVSITLPSESQVCEMFGLSTLPSDFGYLFTFVYNYNYSNTITLTNIRNFKGNLTTYNIDKGDSITLLCAKFPSFHYQIVSYHD